ncbi:MAG: penicillin-binding protein 2 [Salinarimonas sp.]|nr:penicillin-binding protein 2 [Salinarimonas sp.]
MSTPDRDQTEPTQSPDEAPSRGLIGGLVAGLRELFRLRGDKGRARIGLAAFAFTILFAALAGRLVQLGIDTGGEETMRRASVSSLGTARPDIVDRNGEILATDVMSYSVFAEPRNIIDPDEATELLTAVFTDLDARRLRDRLSTDRGFIWVKREISPRQRAEVHRLGIPGVGFLPEHKRVYPNGFAAAHVLGYANVDNEGIAGIEKWIDGQGLQDLEGVGLLKTAADLAPVELSVDLRVQHAMRDELLKAKKEFRAIAAAGLVLDVRTGEVVALVSLPDFDPNNPVDAQKDENINRINVGVYEMGSTLKALTVAMALDSQKFNINSTFDARAPLQFGRQRIRDYRGQNRVLNVPEVFVHSSNIGTARMALELGIEHHREFLRRTGQLERLRTELPENAAPLVPRRWTEVNTATIAFGHGLAMAPLQAAMATAALVNGGYLITPTFLKRSEDQARRNATRVITEETSEAMRYMMRLNAERGSAGNSSIAGFYVGGKTGSAQKVVNGRYAEGVLLTTFFAVAPADDPRYLFLTILDEPKATPNTHGFNTAGWNAAPTTGNIIKRTAHLLDIPPRFNPPEQPFPLMTRLGAWGTQ